MKLCKLTPSWEQSELPVTHPHNISRKLHTGLQQQMKRHQSTHYLCGCFEMVFTWGREASGGICRLFQPKKRSSQDFPDLHSKQGRGNVTAGEHQVRFMRGSSSSWAWAVSSGTGCPELVGFPSFKPCKACFGKALSNFIELKNNFCAKCVLGLDDFCRYLPTLLSLLWFCIKQNLSFM